MKQMKDNDDKMILRETQNSYIQDERSKIPEIAKKRLEKGSELNELEELGHEIVNEGKE